MENWGKLPIVVPKVAFLGTFGTTIGKYHLVPVAWSACKRLRVYTIVDFSFIRTFAPSF